MQVLDLRPGAVVERDYTRSEWPTGVLTAFVMLSVAGFAYLYWLNAGCEFMGAMTWAGKVCIQ